GHGRPASLLLMKSADMDAADDKGCTPLYKACGAMEDESALYLIQQADQILNKGASNGKTPLRKAAARGHRDIVEAIFEKCNRDMSVLLSKDKKGTTPLHAAAHNGRKDVVEYL
ncbi:ankyrin, partial [Bimuria novae-zelandiae CBS 107.79]